MFTIDLPNICPLKKTAVILFSNPDSPTNVLQYPIIIHWVYLTKVVEFQGFMINNS